MASRFPRVAVVGATGAVGLEALSILGARGWPASRIGAFATARSAGTQLQLGGETVCVEPMTSRSCEGYDIALFCADAPTAARYARMVAASGTIVVDNSSAFRMDPATPLIVPEVNGDLARCVEANLLANPNCSTVMLVTALEPLRAAFGVESVIVATYQAASGAGLAAIDELRAQSRAALEGRAVAPSCFPQSCAFNVFPHESVVDGHTGLCGEERKMIEETRRIWKAPSLSITPTCVRVPVVRAHSQAIVVDLEHPAALPAIERALEAAPGVAHFPREGSVAPSPLLASGRDEALVGRVRVDASGRRVQLWVCCDQLRKGAALNALQIAMLRWNARTQAKPATEDRTRALRVPATVRTAS